MVVPSYIVFICCHQCRLVVRDKPRRAMSRGWRLWFGGGRCPDCIAENVAESKRTT